MTEHIHCERGLPRVVLIDSRHARVGQLQQALQLAGFAVVAVLDESADLYATIVPLAPEAIIIAADSPTRDTLEHLAALHQRLPKPMIMFADSGDSQLTRRAAQAGVSAYVVDGLSPAVVRSLVDVAIVHALNHGMLMAELGRTQQALEDRGLVERAKILLMERHGFSEERSYKIMKRLAMRRRERIADLARVMLTAEGMHQA